MAVLKSILRSSALGMCLASAPALGAEAERINSIMQPAIMSQMMMLDEPVANTPPTPVSAAEAPIAAVPQQMAQLAEAEKAEDFVAEPVDEATVSKAETLPVVEEVPPASNTTAKPKPETVVSQMARALASPNEKAAQISAAATVKVPEQAVENKPKEVELKHAKEEPPALSYKLAPRAEGGNASGGMSLEDAIAKAIKNSPEREIASEQVTQALEAVDEARATYFPQLSASAQGGREYNDAFANSAGALNRPGRNWASGTTATLRQMLFDGFITRETVRQRMALLDASKVSKAKVTEELIKSTVEIYMELYQYQQVVAASKENLDALKDIARLVDLRLNAGDASKAEMNYMQARVASAEQSYITSQAALKDAFSALTYLIGEVPEFNASKPALDAYVSGEPKAILDKATKDSMDIQQVKSDQAAAMHELAAAKGRYMPQLDLVVDGGHSDQLGGEVGSRDVASAKLQLTYKLLDGGLRTAATQRQYAKIREVEAKKERITREIVQKVSRNYNKQQTAVKELEIAEQEISANTDLEKLYRKQFKSGDIEISNLVESQERIFSAKMKKFKLESDLVNVTFALLRSTAELLPKFCGNTTGC